VAVVCLNSAALKSTTWAIALQKRFANPAPHVQPPAGHFRIDLSRFPHALRPLARKPGFFGASY
jgi:hypothetical protein